jgi:type VI secretion system secreted protein VgrG
MWIPRIGQEVIVDFLEGDPDRPIITGRVYNADQTVPYPLPDQKTKSTIKSYSSKGGGGFNEIRFEDKKGSEQIFIHAQKDEDIRIENILRENVGADTNLIVGNDQLEKITKDKHLQVKGDHKQKIDGNESLQIGQNLDEKIGQTWAAEAGQTIHLKAGMTVIVEAGVQISLKVGGNFVDISPAGVTIVGTMVLINSGGSAGSGPGAHPESPKDPAEADKADPGQASGPPITFQGKRTVVPPDSYSPMALALKSAADSGAPFCDI